MRNSTAIPVQGDEAYTSAFKAFAKTKKTTQAKLVRSALDSAYGDELKPYLSFFADIDNNNCQSSEKSDN